MTRRSLALVLSIGLVAAACGGGEDASDTTASQSTVAATTTTLAAETTQATTTTTQATTTTVTFDPAGAAMDFSLQLELTSWENGGDGKFGPEIGSVVPGEGDNSNPYVRLVCFGTRCLAEGWVGGSGWGGWVSLSAGSGGSLIAETITDQNCSGDVVGTETLTVDLMVDFAAGTVTGDVSRISSPLEAGDCLYSSETRTVTGSFTKAGTCFEILSPETCIAFEVGEDRPSHFDRPPEWPAQF